MNDEQSNLNIHVNITSEMEKAYLDYAMSVIVSRALPDIRDGLKPVQRRIVYDMYKQNFTPSNKYQKCAAVVGDVIKNFHPHGDQALYGTLVRMAQPFTMRYQLIDGQGNFGSVDGDPPAAMRYTESRLAKISLELLQDIDSNTVNFMPNYTGDLEEPTVLPTQIPNLLLNGSQGIAVGMATNIAPHNLGELMQAIKMVIQKGQPVENPKPIAGTDIYTNITSFDSEATSEDIMEIVKGPDFPTKGEIFDRKAIIAAYTSGKGGIVMRGIATIEEMRGGRMAIAITELPYQVNKAMLVAKIADLVKKDKLDGISDLRDESDRSGMRVVVELKRDTKPQKVLNALYKHTELQKTFNVNMVALVHGEPKLVNIKTILLEFVRHRQEVVIRRTLHFLGKAREREHILEGLMIALDHLDEVIRTIRESADANVAREALMGKFELSELQAVAILDMQLRKLAALERQKIKDELDEIRAKIAGFLELLGNPTRVLEEIDKEFDRILEVYKKELPRFTKVHAGAVGEISEEELIQEEAVIITLTDNGYIKRLKQDTYKEQGRGGKGVKGITTKENDNVNIMLSVSTTDELLFFSNKGKVYALKAHEIPESSRTAKGTPIINLIDIDQKESISAILKPTLEGKYLFFVTQNGLIKRVEFSEFTQIRKNGKLAINLASDDSLIYVLSTTGTEEIILVTKLGQSIRFKESDVRAMGRVAAGVKGISLKKSGDAVVGCNIASDDKFLMTVTEFGFGKCTSLQEYKVQNRSGSGIKAMELTKKTGNLVNAQVINKTEEGLILTSANGQVIRLAITDIKEISRSTQGVKLLKLSEGDTLVAASII